MTPSRPGLTVIVEFLTVHLTFRRDVRPNRDAFPVRGTARCPHALLQNAHWSFSVASYEPCRCRLSSSAGSANVPTGSCAKSCREKTDEARDTRRRGAGRLRTKAKCRLS